MPTAPLPEQLTVLPWTNADLDRLGHDPRSTYVEDYWLGLIGPSGTWIMRRLAAAFDHDHDGFVLHAPDLAAEIGLGRGIGANAPVTRTIGRLELFDLVRRDGDILHTRRRLPELSRRQLARLPEHLGRAHEHLNVLRNDNDHIVHHTRRAKRIATVLAELGEHRELIESRLHGWRVPPAIAAEAAAWATSRAAHPSYSSTEVEVEPAELTRSGSNAA